MSHLGALLDLPEGSRLTGVALHPVCVPTWSPAVTAHLQLVLLPETAEPSARTGALAAFLPEVFASLHGTSPDGGSWAAFLLLTHGDHLVIPRDGVALAPLRRALSLLGLDGAAQRTVTLTEKALRWVYWQSDTASVASWTMDELLLGLLVELAGVPLPDLVDFAERDGEAAPGDRRDRMASLLESWSEV